MKSKNLIILSLVIGIMFGTLNKLAWAENSYIPIKLNNSNITSNRQGKSWSISLPWYGDRIIVDSKDFIYQPSQHLPQ